MKKTGNALENYSCLAKTDRGYPTSIAGKSSMSNCVHEGKMKGLGLENLTIVALSMYFKVSWIEMF